jgi:Uma2 family endonuclease
MNILATPPPLTAEDLLTLPDANGFELVNGILVEKKMGAKASWVGSRCSYFLTSFSDAHHLGWVLDSEGSYQCFSSPRTVRKPDVSFIRFGRLPEEKLPNGHVRIPPDLAVEVVSPNDLVYEVDQKLFDYLEAKIPLIWIIDPEVCFVHVYRTGGSVSLLRERDELNGENVLPGFRCPVSALFLPPTPPGPTAGDQPHA